MVATILDTIDEFSCHVKDPTTKSNRGIVACLNGRELVWIGGMVRGGVGKTETTSRSIVSLARSLVHRTLMLSYIQS